MNCTQCGAPIEGNLKFCTQCGARVTGINEHIETITEIMQEEDGQPQERVPQEEISQEVSLKAERTLSRPVAKSQPRPKKPKPAKQVETSRQETYRQKGQIKGKRYEWENRKGLNGFAETLLALIVNPIGSGEELYVRLSKKATLIYMTAILLVSACVSYLIYMTTANKIATLFSETLDYFLGYGAVQYVLDELSIQVLLIAIISCVLVVVYMTALVMGIYRIILKVDIEWIECIQLMLMPMVIGFFGKVLLLILGFINVKLMLILCIVVWLLIAVLVVVQFINRLGLSAITVYSMPVVYILCSFIRLIIIVQILRNYI